MFHTIKHGTLEYLTADALEGAIHCFSTRYGGVSEGQFSTLNLGTSRGDKFENVVENYRILGSAVGFTPEEVVHTWQEHTDTILRVGKADRGKGLFRNQPEVCDGLITDEPGVALVCFAADCTPVLLFDPVKNVAAAVHAGWRGRLTNHKVFGEANAVLAGDALLTAAFGQLARAELPAERIGKAVALLSQRAGECGMVGGQVLDLAGEQLVLTEEEIYNVHRLKTGALISAACQLGVIAAGGTQEQLDAADRYAEALGFAFQTRDDMLDVLGDAGKMGKATGMDENKNTFVRLYGVGACSRLIEKETQKSIEALGVFEDSEFLKELSMKLAIREC